MSMSLSRRAFVCTAAAVATVPAFARSGGQTDELAALDATGIAALIRSKKLSAREATDAAIRRIEAYNGTINAVIRTRFEQALDFADTVDPSLPFAGVPTLIKDVSIKGEPFYNGAQIYAEIDYRADHTDEFVNRIDAMGMPILGVTNIPEFASAPTTESKLHGPCHNPWSLGHSAGGSSGGAAAAVATRMVPLAQSSDGGGSSRIPASANGLYTIKTTRGRTPSGPASAGWLDITSSKGFVTRSVRDFAGAIDALGGPSSNETLFAPAKSRPYLDELGQSPGKLRIGLCRQLPGNMAPLHPEALVALDQSAELLSSLGHHVEEASPATFTSTESFAIISAYWPLKVAFRANAAERVLQRKLTPDDMEPGTYQLVEYARQHSIMDFADTLRVVADFTLRSLEWWKKYDILLTPTTGSPPPRLGELGDIGTDAGRLASLRWGGLTMFANITGQPAASVPLYWTPDGLPIGTQLVADIGREDILLRLSSQLEQARPWVDRRPPVLAGGEA